MIVTSYSKAMLGLTPEQRMAMAWWVFFDPCDCPNCCRLRHAWHASRLQGGK